MTQYSNDTRSRQVVVDALVALGDKGLNKGTSGNVSVATSDGMLITPTGVNPEQLQPEHIVHMTLDGQPDADQLTPSSEWKMHADVYANKPGITAVVHCHSPYATILACARKPIPAMHYMVAATGSCCIPLADYATFGSQALSDANVDALSSSLACLLANHGQLATGFNIESALKLAELVEEQAHCYWGTLAIGGPVVLDKAQMDDVLVAFASYGQQAERKDLARGNKLNKD
ncbi:fuculose phosphate aldolase [Halioglobus sp. HI00S01]|uniref:class II aldolase/adducin family protein n=1 Tax=Halioglobus sp. HI00S01 TaxID=1822214 RepID=UPI0007C3C714|nr:class II aldolase/adducin family protein [Halioglobus sp. HI00S01]KZX60513.1 fuculose phosphate aldolase [Halioglobus sp. HI00S01]